MTLVLENLMVGIVVLLLFSMMGILFWIVGFLSASSLPQERKKVIKILQMASDQEGKCCICYERYGQKQECKKVYAFACDHAYCQPCIVEWLFQHDTCPLCRSL